jgi:hypothetical protein
MARDTAGKPGEREPRRDHRGRGLGWPPPSKLTSPPRSWTNKTMHHPATRIGEIKHGKT